MDFGSVTWVAYLATGLVGVGFGLFQGVLMRRAALGSKPRHGLFLLKLALWAMALVTAALISIPLLLVFVAVSTLTMLIVSLWFYHTARKEGA